MTQARITLDLNLSEEPVEGYVATRGEEPRRFSGYAGLIAALESIRSTNGHHRAGEAENNAPAPHPR